jgi:hypothetical protein
MEQSKEKTVNAVMLLLTSFSVLLPLYFFIKTSSEKISTETYVTFIGILIFLIICIIIYYFYSKWEEATKRSDNNSKAIGDIKKDIKTQSLYNNMEKRLSILEALLKSKKGHVDPRILFAIILSILLFLFLKSINLFG